MTAREFAKLINRPYPTIAQWLRDGRIPEAELIDIGSMKMWMIPREALVGFRLPQMGRPKDVKDSKKRRENKPKKGGAAK